jgi:uncharacterized membrane protein YoaK (UPF0700 family)
MSSPLVWNKGMPEANFVARHWPKMMVALVLTFASGLVDITGYLGVFHLFTAHLTGTTVQLGHSLVARHTVELLAAASIVSAFLVGSVLGRALIEIGSRKRIRRIASITFSIESGFLVTAILLPRTSITPSYTALALLAGAMGIQTATLTGIGPLTVHTTFVTGMLNKIAQLVSHILFRAHDFRKSRTLKNAERGKQRFEIEMTLFLAAIWCCYVAGAAFGTWSFAIWNLRALFVAIALLGLSLVVDEFCPLSIQEEREQSER